MIGEIDWESEACKKGEQDALVLLSKCDDPRTYMAVCQGLHGGATEAECSVSDSSTELAPRTGRTPFWGRPAMGTIAGRVRSAAQGVRKAMGQENGTVRIGYAQAHPARYYTGLAALTVGLGFFVASLGASPVAVGTSTLFLTALGIRR